MSQFMSDIFNNSAVHLLLGALITWFAAYHYYKRAGDELKTEAERLDKTNRLILRWLENKGENVEIIRDESGTPIALRHNIDLSDSLGVTAKVTGIRLNQDE